MEVGMAGKTIIFTGAWTALVTPFKADGSLDLPGFERNIEHQIKGGVDGILPLGTTGEAPTIEAEEQEELIRTAVRAAKGRVPVMVGAGTNSTLHTIGNAKRAERLGADMVLIVTPYYSKPTNEGIYRHFKAVAEAVSLPIVAYNIQSRTAKNIDTPTMQRLSGIPSIIGVKESSGSVEQVGEVVQSVKGKRPDFGVLSGDDAFTLPLMALGGDGVVSVIANLVPELVSALVKAASRGDFAKARELHYRLLPLVKAAFIETNPIPIKTAMGMAGLAGGPLRLPLCEMEKANEEKLRKTLVDMGIVK
jgi:4-hydroxy-tetrahydrodipicolinate synthase